MYRIYNILLSQSDKYNINTDIFKRQLGNSKERVYHSLDYSSSQCISATWASTLHHIQILLSEISRFIKRVSVANNSFCECEMKIIHNVILLVLPPYQHSLSELAIHPMSMLHYLLFYVTWDYIPQNHIFHFWTTTGTCMTNMFRNVWEEIWYFWLRCHAATLPLKCMLKIAYDSLYLWLVWATVPGYPAAVRVWNRTGWSSSGCYPETRGTQLVRAQVGTGPRFHITVPATLPPIKYLSSDRIVTWSVRKLCGFSPSFTSRCQICDSANIRRIAVK